jgi:hypothetical protein
MYATVLDEKTVDPCTWDWKGSFSYVESYRNSTSSYIYDISYNDQPAYGSIGVSAYGDYGSDETWANVYLAGFETTVEKAYVPAGVGMRLNYSILPYGLPYNSGCLEIYDESWSVIMYEELISGYSGYIDWDGLGNCAGYYGEPLPAGTYYVCVEVEVGNGALCGPDNCTFTVVYVDSVTVESGATQTNVTGAKNWAAVKATSGDVIVKAVLNPTIPNEHVPDVLSWSGGSAVSGDPLRRTVSKTASAETPVTATCGLSSDYVDIWTIWATGEIRTSGSKSSGNNKTWTAAKGGDTLGPLNDEDDGITAGEATGKMEGVFTLYPTGVYDIVSNGWDIKRWIDFHDYENGSTEEADSRSDDNVDTDEDLVPDNDDKIYVIDGPTIPFGLNHTFETYNTFSEWVEWNGTKCSGNYYWHYRARVDDDLDASNKPHNDDTELNDVGTGQITPQSSAYYSPR